MNLGLVWAPGLPVPFEYPSAGNPRVAVLLPGFRETRQVRYFDRLDNEAALRFAPEVLAGTAIQLRRIATKNRPTTVRNAVVVFTRESDPGLTEYDRDMFWDIFGVPAFEQYLSRRNRLLASECDAHEGLHIRTSSARREGWIVDPAPCACGDTRPRLMPTPGFAPSGLRLCEERP